MKYKGGCAARFFTRTAQPPYVYFSSAMFLLQQKTLLLFRMAKVKVIKICCIRHILHCFDSSTISPA